MKTISHQDVDGTFDVSVFESPEPKRVVLFGVGGGGDPRRHLPLLECLCEAGCTVVAPHFEMMKSHFLTGAELTARARRMRLALDSAARPRIPVAGVGHSIGAAMLLALAGGLAWTRGGELAGIERDGRLERLVLMAPATDFFQVQGALDKVCLPILVFAGTEDIVTPLSRVRMMESAVGDPSLLELRVVEGAGHFSFMNVPPPASTEPLADRASFLESLAAAVLEFIEY